MQHVHHRACHLCEAICGLKITVEAGKVMQIKGDPEDPLSRGHICPKAIALKDLHEDKDRLRFPVRKIIDKTGFVSWQEIGWDEALKETALALVKANNTYGVDSIGAYFGNPSVHNYGMLTHQNNLFRFFKTKNRFSATSVDQLPHHLVSMWMFGHKSLFPIPDIDRTDYFLMLGANPLASNGSMWTVPDVKKRIKSLKNRGGKLIVIDPRKTETAKIATEHFFIKPGTDAILLASLLRTLIVELNADGRQLKSLIQGLDEVKIRLGEFRPESVETITGIDASNIRRLAKELYEAPAAICYGRMGVSTQRHGTLCQWLIQLINVVTGNLDKSGGSLFTLPAVDQVPNTRPGGFGRHLSRVRGLPEFDNELPASTLADEILTPGIGQVKTLFTGAGNPVLSTPNGSKLDQALEKLDFMVSLDFYINETTRHADIILPPTSPLEHDHYDLAFHINSIRNTARFNEPVFEKPLGALHDWEIFTRLGELVAKELGLEPRPTFSPSELIDASLKNGPYGTGRKENLSLETLRQHPSGVDLGPLKTMLPERLLNPNKKIICDTNEPIEALSKLSSEFNEPSESSLYLIGRRHVRSNNSWMHNFRRLVKGKNRCTLLMHPDDIKKRDLTDGNTVRVTSRVKSIDVSVEKCLEIMPGTVSLPHGYGHTRKDIQLSVAETTAGASCNDITDERYLDKLSGNAALNGVLVSVENI